MQQSWLIWCSTMMMKHGVTCLTTDKVLTGTRQVVSLHRRNAAEDETGMTEICATSSMTEMHVAREERDYDYYGPYYDQPHQQRSPEGGCNIRGVKAFSNELKSMHSPLNFKPSGIRKYDGSTNPAEWLEEYQLTIEATGGDSYIMKNYLPVCLSSSARTWLLRLPTGSIRS
jgi:hypothetical protein